ncbi:MAG: LacI family DNA-binding transcriptional regulator, partial [Lachnospiraceae bacterium]|nr:LacI family DNA-binding transcriptional regulator [Lachnospiraceae bacterium]
MATLKDVARETGLTVTTVSRILNNRGYISEESRKKVQEAMKKLDYHPNEVARALSKKSSNIIGVIVPHINKPYFAEMISNLENEAKKKKYNIMLFNSKSDDDNELKYIDMCKSNRVAGVIMMSGSFQLDEFKDLHIPLITIERNLECGTASVECDNFHGGEIAARELIECGASKLLHISGVSETEMPADERAAGFIKVCEETGTWHREISTTGKQYDSGEYRDFITEVLTEYPEIDGVFASSDVIAAQVIQIANTMGKKIPDELKIVGFDDTSIASLTCPTITSIRQPIKEMAKTAISFLLDAAAGKVVPTRMILPVKLNERET